MKTKILKVYHDHGFGFPVTLYNVPTFEFRGELVPDVNQKILQETVLQALALMPGRLTGRQVRYIRLYAHMNLERFAKRFDVSHPAVIKWEKSKHKVTAMNWATEKDIRLFALQLISTSPKKFLECYEKLDTVESKPQTPIEIDLQKIAA